MRDLRAECIVVPDKDFDVDSSIFGVLPEKIKMAAAASQMKPYWSDAAVARADKAYEEVKPVAEERKPLLQFMATECDFKLEHADGSFMDHLTFCRDYCAAHYSCVSSTPLFIHSIMGVGTNVRRHGCLLSQLCLAVSVSERHRACACARARLIGLGGCTRQIFPMEAHKIPMLASILTPDEMDHVQAFPSILRIVAPISTALRENLYRIQQLEGITFHRLIDNELISLTGPQLWVQLNYHLIHLMDFLPIADWLSNKRALTGFAQLHCLLSDAGELGVKIDLNLSDSEGLTLADVVGDPCAVRFRRALQMPTVTRTRHTCP